MLLKAIPVLPATDLRASIDFYERRLGFSGKSFGTYALLHQGSIEIRLELISKNVPFHATACYFYVENIEDLYAGFSIQEVVEFSGRLTDQPQGMRQFSLKDNNGNLLQFGEQK